MYFQALKYKERNFLKLNNNENTPICLIYAKDRAWLNHFSSLNLLCVYITRLITNHVLIVEYRLRFFPKESIVYPWGNYPIKTRRHISFE